MDHILAGLVARYPRVQWEAAGGGWLGSCGPVGIRVEADDFGVVWASGWVVGTDLGVTCPGADPVTAVGKLAIHRKFSAALHSAPVDPVRVVEYVPPTAAELAGAQTPQRVPFPAMLISPALGSCLALAFVFTLALVAGAGAMWWLTGGAS